jgi:hypothetical protein
LTGSIARSASAVVDVTDALETATDAPVVGVVTVAGSTGESALNVAPGVGAGDETIFAGRLSRVLGALLAWGAAPAHPLKTRRATLAMMATKPKPREGRRAHERRPVNRT